MSTLFIDNNGKALSGRTVNFTIYDPNSSIAASGSGVTDQSGIANFYKDINSMNFYGVWKVKAESGGVSSYTTFIYNWWGCAWATTGECGGLHSDKSPADMGTAAANSPYTVSWERTTDANAAHNIDMNLNGWSGNYCTVCHQSYDGNPTTSNIEGNTTKDFFVKDVHRNISCTNAACHDPNGTSAWNNHNTGSMTIGSCDNCHNRTDISKKSTLNGAVSNYSNGSGTYNKYHTPNATVPCIICHGPMHNVSKPDPAAGGQNNVTEDTQCTACHQGYSRHNGSVNCTLCHSSDAHYIQVTGGASYVNTNSPARSDCTTCHQNTTFMDAVKTIPKAGNYTGRNAPQVPVPVAHSDDSMNGSKWNQSEPYWTNTSRIENCKYCHGETMHKTAALGRPSLFSGGNPVNGTISSAMTWCQQCHWQGSPGYSVMLATFKEDNKAIPPEITGNVTYGNVNAGDGTAYVNHSSFAKDDATCRNCHGTGSENITGFMHGVAVGSGGGPGCLGCHNTSSPQNFTGMRYIDGSSFGKSAHANMNSNNASGYGINASCWACHNSTGTVVPDNTHPDRMTTPFICTDCHLAGGSMAGAYNATVIFNHFSNGTIRAPDNATSDIASCMECHENVSGMLLPNNDNDTGTFTSGVGYGNGGNKSAYHYGESQLNFGKTKGSDEYCIYCHRNETGEFNGTFMFASNSSISNHSLRYNASNPSCGLVQCHNSTGSTLHGNGLIRPATGYNSTYCLDCHGSNSSSGAANYSGITTGTKSRHNNSINCEKCHMNNGTDIHPAKYLQPDGMFNTGNSTAVNCVFCHQTGTANFPNAAMIPFTHHSDNYSNGSRWNLTKAYWTNTSQQGMCNYCHGDSRHSENALGRPANWSGLNIINSSTTSNSTWCSGCHYQGYTGGSKNYNSMVQAFEGSNLPVPPEITNHSTYAPYGISGYLNHSLSPDYSDSTCKECHGPFLPNGTGMDGFLHNVSTGTGCTGCHFSYSYMNTAGAPAMFVN
ncbi:Cytochrome c7 c [uncultured archaeon]|nr:Cytochrome c7 c [uncultured archaeon]